MTGMLISRFFSRVERVETCRISKCFTCSTWTKSALRYALLLVVTVVAEGTTISDGMKWYDGRELPIEGRAFDNTEHYYDRLPSNVTTSVNSGVRSGKHNTSGMLFRFSTDSTRLVLKWTPYKSSLSMDHMPAMGVSGIDVYRFDAAKGRWRYVKAGRITSSAGATLSLDWTPGTPCLVNLPLYNGIKTFTLGIDPEASVSPLPPRASGIDKPVVFYGTSITQGGCASRPGMSFVNIVGRDLDVPVVNLGFSGSGLMELEMSEHLAAIDASCYVLDCVWNMRSMTTDAFRDRYETFIRNLRARRPDVPIVMAGMSDVYCGGPNDKDACVRALYERLVAEGWTNLVHLPKDGMYSGDFEGTVDGTHANNLGMRSLARVYGKAVKQALNITTTSAK